MRLMIKRNVFKNILFLYVIVFKFWLNSWTKTGEFLESGEFLETELITLSHRQNSEETEIWIRQEVRLWDFNRFLSSLCLEEDIWQNYSECSKCETNSSFWGRNFGDNN